MSLLKATQLIIAIEDSFAKGQRTLSFDKDMKAPQECLPLLTSSSCRSNSLALAIMSNKAISNVFGTLGAVCWSVQLTPQIILNWRRHSAAGLSPAFMLFWACAGVPLGVFNIVSDFSIALQVQPQILTGLSLVTWGQCYYYEQRWSWKKVLALVIPCGCFLGGVEAALIFALRVGVQRGTQWPVTLMAVLAALLLALGVMEQYLAIWKNRSVEGISFLFCGIDALGDLTSIISVIFERQVSILGLVIYSVELLLWMGVFACGCYFKLMPWTRRMIEKKRLSNAANRRGPAVQHAVALHDIPSSTSVFRMAEGEYELRSRPQAVVVPA